ncbi:MAG: hypothetical protein KBG84_04875 [Planctomycetes bacterium]|nr:hypothetical protein [Planctomycetota bacterium]
MSNRLFSLIASCLFFLVAACAFAPAASARDLSEYGYYLGVRLKMYDEAERLLTKQMESGSDADKSKAKSALARVYKAKADDDFLRSGNEKDRDEGYEKAERLYGDPEKAAEKVELAVLRLEIAKARARSDAEGARGLVAKALETLMAQQALLETTRSQMGDDPFFAAPEGARYRTCVYNVCVAHYVNGLTHGDGSPERSGHFKRAEDAVNEAVFLLPISVEYVDALLLLGEIARSSRNFEGAVAKFLDVPSVLGDYPPGYDIGFQAMRGWLKAAEIMTGELGYDKKFLQMCVEQYQKASSRYGGIKDLASEFKRFKLYQIGAQIKLGGNIAVALSDLFLLAQEPDINFKRQALTVLADIGASEGLDPETRLLCGRAVLKDALVVGYGPIFKVLRAYQVLLAQCNTAQTFESFAPECYRQLGFIYADLLQRYMDAAMIYRDACLRTGYFRTKFGKDFDTAPEKGIEIPAHMKDKNGATFCELISDTKSAFDFPAEMSKAYAKVAGWLVSSKFGDPKNAEFAKVKEDADYWKALFSGEEAQIDQAFGKASEKYNAKQYGPAAVRFAKLPAKYKKFRLALYYAANAYMAQLDDPTARHPSRMGEDVEQESSQYFEEMKRRHGEDLAGLPKELWENVETPHFEAMANATLKGDVAIWHKALYFFKKYMLYVVLRNWDEVKDSIDVKKHDFVDAFMMISDRMAQRWRAQPERTRQPNEEMQTMGRAAYGLAYLLRNPRKNDPNEASVLNAGRPTALRILKVHWELFGPHFPKEDADVQKAVLNLSFGCLADEKDGDGCEAILKAYEAAFGASEEGKKKVAYYIAQIYLVYLDTLDPKVQALNSASTNLRSLFNQLKLGMFLTESMFLQDKDAAKKFADAKTTLDKDKAMAEYFWKFWLSERTLGGDPKKFPAASVGTEVLPIIKKKWDEFAEFYPKRWGEAQKAEFDALVKEKAYDAIRADAQKLVASGSPTEIVDKLQAKGDGPYGTLALQVSLNTSHLRYFTGTTFIYDFGGFLEETSGALDERLRPMLTKVLTYYERYQETKPNQGATEARSQYVVGKNFFRVRDYKRAAGYLQHCLDLLRKDNFFVNENVIPVNKQSMTAGLAAKGMMETNTKSGEELELKYQLGRSYFELYKQDKNVESLKKAAVLIRRAYCFVLLRNANEMGKNQRSGRPFAMTFKEQIELYYLDTIDTLIAINLELNALKAPKVDYPPFVDQFNIWLDPEAKDAKTGKVKLQEMPANEAEYLWHARRIHFDQWTSFAQLTDHPFRPEWRRSLRAWGDLTIEVLKKYGKSGEGIKDLVDVDSQKKLSDEVQVVLDIIRNKSLASLGYDDTETKAFKKGLKDCADSLLAKAKDLKLTVK